jgi:hypothetical protein
MTTGSAVTAAATCATAFACACRASFYTLTNTSYIFYTLNSL